MCLAFPNSEYYAQSDCLAPFRLSSLLYLSSRTSFLWGGFRLSHVHTNAFFACHALRPRVWHVILPIFTSYMLLSSSYLTLSTTPQNPVNGAQSLQPMAYGLQIPLSTLNRLCYHTRPKTRYEMLSVKLFRSYFQRLAVVRFRGARDIRVRSILR